MKGTKHLSNFAVDSNSRPLKPTDNKLAQFTFPVVDLDSRQKISRQKPKPYILPPIDKNMENECSSCEAFK